MATAIILVLTVAGAATLVWRAVPEARRRRLEEEGMSPFELTGPGETAAPAFSLQSQPVREDLPPRPLSIARIAVAVLFVAALGAGLAWAIGTAINNQLERMLLR